MSLLGNISLLHKSPAKYTTGSAGFNDRANWNKPGMMRNRGNLTVSTAWKFDAIPSGMYAGRAFFPPQKAGVMRAREAVNFDASGLAVGGITANGSASLSISFADATAALIASGAGTASLTFTVSDALLTASIGGIGLASFTFTATGNAGALASGSGSASMAITLANAQAYPLNDASPLRTATSSFAINGTLVPYAIGVMGGSTVTDTVLTTSAIASEVWSTLAASFTVAGTMGNKLNSAASGGVDYGALADSVLTDPRFKSVLTTGNFLALKD